MKWTSGAQISGSVSFTQWPGVGKRSILLRSVHLASAEVKDGKEGDQATWTLFVFPEVAKAYHLEVAGSNVTEGSGKSRFPNVVRGEESTPKGKNARNSSEYIVLTAV